MAPDDISDVSQAVVIRLLRYVKEHPQAKDTCKGIVKWWFGENDDTRNSEEVQQALDWLVACGWFTARTLTETDILYGAQKDQLKNMIRFLKELEEGNRR